MPILITPKDPVPAKAFHFSRATPQDIWDAADLVTDLGFTLNAKWYKDPSPSAPDTLMCDITIRPLGGMANDTNTLKALIDDWLTYDNINMVIKTDAEVQAAYDLQDSPPPEPPLVEGEPEGSS